MFSSFATCIAKANGETGFGGGWTIYPPLNTAEAECGPEWLTPFWMALGSPVFWLVLFALLGAAIAFLARRLGLKGRALLQYPAFMAVTLLFGVWSVASLFVTDRSFGTTFFDPAGGGDPVMFQHLFWFLGHPEVWLTGFVLIGGGLSWVQLARRGNWGPLAWLAVGVFLILFAGFIGWSHHMYTVGMPLDLARFRSIGSLFFMSVFALPLLVAGARFVRGISWASLDWLPLSWLFGLLAFLGLTIWTGFMLAGDYVGSVFNDTYYVVALFHQAVPYVAALALFAALYRWFEPVFGTAARRGLAYAHFWLIFVGANLAFLPSTSLGAAGMPQRYSDAAAPSSVWLQVSITGHALVALSVLVFIMVVVDATRRRRRGEA